MNFLDAAYQVLKGANKPLHYAEIARRALEQGLIAPQGQTPEATMGSRLYVDTKKENTRFKRASRGHFALVERAQSDEISQRVNVINLLTRKKLAQLLHEMPADRFEALVGELLLALGFEEDSIEVTRYHGDGGIDVRGILDAGGITRISAAVQVKRWKANISAPTVRNVRGALTTQEQGIIITTSNFSRGAIKEAVEIGKTPISLVNGSELLDLLIGNGIGINREQHVVYSLDEEWWGELIGATEESPTGSGSEIASDDVPTDPIPANGTSVKVTYPVPVRAANNSEITAELLDARGTTVFNGKSYRSPSGAGKDASGWKSTNGWKYWLFQHPDTAEWLPIDLLRHNETPSSGKP